jgi:hypothetical protein
MREELELDLVSRAPAFWREYRQEGSCLHYGMEVGNGWYSLLANLSLQLNDIEETGWCVQCKSKFGYLCVYVKNASPMAHQLIRGAESVAVRTCPNCGELATAGQKERAGVYHHWDDKGKRYTCNGC